MAKEMKYQFDLPSDEDGYIEYECPTCLKIFRLNKNLFMVSNKVELYIYAKPLYWAEKTFDASIRKLLETSMKPLIEYIQLKLNNILLEAEAEESQVATNVHNGDVIMGGNVQKVENGNATMKDVGNNKSRKKFSFQKESFWLGVLSAVIAGLIVFGIEELIRHLIA